MPRFYFHVREGDVLSSDDGQGEELQDVEAARLVAVDSAKAILSEASWSGRALSLNCQIEVADEAGRTILIEPVGTL